MAIYLQITEGTKNQEIKLGIRPIFLGRSSKCHITLHDNMISGKHLAIKINRENHVVIKDLDTTNGTYLNGNKIDEGLLYLEDFIQIGRVKISLLPTGMTSQELKIHQRDFERTNVTFVKLGNQVSNSHYEDESEQGFNQQQSLLAKVRKQKQQIDTNLSVTRPQTPTEKDEVEQPSITFSRDDSPKENLGTKDEDDDEYVEEEENEDANGLVSKVKGLFNKS